MNEKNPSRPRPLFLLATCVFVAGAAIVFCWRFQHAVFAGDMGLKYLQALTFQSGRLALDYPGERFDPTGRSFPFEPPVVFPTTQGWVAVWLNPMVMFLIPLFDRLFGWAGYLMAPFLGGLLSVVGLRNLGQELHLPRGADAAALVWLTTPLLFYSLILWEHTLAVGCGLIALAFLLRALRKGEPTAASGLWLGASALFRSEAALAAGILCLTVLVSRRKKLSFVPLAVWGVCVLIPPLAWACGVSYLAGTSTTAQMTFPYRSPFSPWTGDELSRHLMKIFQTLVEPYQDAGPTSLGLACCVLIPLLIGFFIPQSRSKLILFGVGLLFMAGLILVGVQLGAEKVFYAGIFAACPALALVTLIPKRPQTRNLAIACLFSMVLLAVIAPNNGGLQRGCRYLLAPCVFGSFLVVCEWFRMKGVSRATVGLVLLLGAVVQIYGLEVLWDHKSSKEEALIAILDDRPDFVLTSVWYFPQEAGRIYSQVPIVWTRTGGEIHNVLINTENLDPKPDRFLTILPSQASDIDEVNLPNWEGERTGAFGSLPILRLQRVGG